MLSWCCVVSMHTLMTLHRYLLWKYQKNLQDDVGFKMTTNQHLVTKIGAHNKLEFGAHMDLCKTLMKRHLPWHLKGQVLFHNLSYLLQTYPHFIKYPPQVLLCPSLQPSMMSLAYALPCSPNVPTSRQLIIPSWATYPLFLSLSYPSPIPCLFPLAYL